MRSGAARTRSGLRRVSDNGLKIGFLKRELGVHDPGAEHITDSRDGGQLEWPPDTDVESHLVDVPRGRDL